MGAHAHLRAVGVPGVALASAVAQLEDLELRWTRFRADSELSQLSAAEGSPMLLSSETLAVLALAVEAWSVTGGLFDPTLRDEVEAAGYDRTWPLAAGGHETPPCAHAGGRGRRHPTIADLYLMPEVGVALCPAGLHFDLGGIGKGRAADLLVGGLMVVGASGAAVSIGGDLAVAGCDDDGEPFTVDVEDPFTNEPRWRLQLAAGGVATSGVRQRRWRVGDSSAHHVIDPRTGRCSRSPLVAATVAAGTAAWAEALATAVLVGGAEVGTALLERTGVAGLMVDQDGTVTEAGNWSELVVDQRMSMLGDQSVTAAAFSVTDS